MSDQIKVTISVVVLLIMLSGIIFTAGTLRQQIYHNSIGISDNKTSIAERKLSGVEMKDHSNRITKLETEIVDNGKDHLFFIDTTKEIEKRLRGVEQKH